MIQDIGHEFDEAALVAQAQRGGVEAFTHLVNQYERNIFRLARHITQNMEDAEDVLQETFLKAYEHLEDFQGNSKFYTWLVRIAVNQSLMKLRKRKSDASVSLDDPFDTGAETIVREVAVSGPESRTNVFAGGNSGDSGKSRRVSAGAVSNGFRAAGY